MLFRSGAVRARDKSGVVRYHVQLASNGLLLSATPSANLVVLKTYPGGAQLLASTLDNSEISGLIGTIAGDDTIIAVSATSDGGKSLAEKLLKLFG